MSEKKEIKFAKNAIYVIVPEDVLAIDITTQRSSDVLKAINVVSNVGIIVGTVMDCKQKLQHANGEGSRFNVKVTFVTESDEVNEFGEKSYSQISTWINSPRELAIGETIAIKANSFVVNRNRDTRDLYNVARFISSLEPKKNVVSEDGKRINERYELWTNDNFETGKKEPRITTIQGSKFYTVRRATVVEDEV